MDVYSTMSKQLCKTLDDPYYKKLPLNFLYKFKHDCFDVLDAFPNCKIMVDSGAYFFNSRETSQDSDKTKKFIDEYKEYIINTKDDSRFVGYFDMDLRYLGLPEIKNIREELFDLTDKIIPVFHSMWGIHEFKSMCRDYDYIGYPCSSWYSPEDYLPFVKYAHKHNCKIHGLGMNRKKVMEIIPFNSVDSAHWVREAFVAYYTNHNIEKNTENNRKYSKIYYKKEIINQHRMQMYYEDHWSSYMKKHGFK